MDLKNSDKDQTNRALNRIATYLAQRDHSELEIQTKLKGKFNDEAILEAIEVAKQNRWISPPDELAEQVTESLHLKNKGYLYIQNYLQKLGLPEPPLDDERERSKCLDILNSKYSHWQEFSPNEKQKPMRFLQSRGFCIETIESILL